MISTKAKKRPRLSEPDGGGGLGRAIDQQAKERQKRKPNNSVVENFPQQEQGKARDAAGKAVASAPTPVQQPDIEPGRSAFATLRRELLRAKDAILAIETQLGMAEVCAAAPPRGDEVPRANEAGFAVEYAGKSCRLGNTIVFRLASKLLERPGQYCTNRELATFVWGVSVSAGTIRSAVHVLRQALARAGMGIVIDAARNSYSAAPSRPKSTEKQQLGNS